MPPQADKDNMPSENVINSMPWKLFSQQPQNNHSTLSIPGSVGWISCKRQETNIADIQRVYEKFKTVGLNAYQR